MPTCFDAPWRVWTSVEAGEDDAESGLKWHEDFGCKARGLHNSARRPRASNQGPEQKAEGLVVKFCPAVVPTEKSRRQDLGTAQSPL